MSTNHNIKKLPIVDLASLIPDKVFGMKKLDKEAFKTSVKVPTVKCMAKLCGVVQSVFKNLLFNRPHFRKIIPCPVSTTKERLILLHTSIQSKNEFSNEQRLFMTENSCEFVIHEMDLSYSDFSFDEILKSVFPKDTKDIVTSFETVGHIAHVNLKPAMLEFKNLIGEVLLEKNKHIKTVVNKTNSIEETYRFFKMELLAGEDKMLATVYEHGCVFEFDYSKVYWNSRLQTEHQRIADLIKPNDIVFDVFAGVGPFAMPIAKKKCKVFANDLNVNSYKALLHNIKLNKVEEYITAFNMDGREFLETIVMDKNLCVADCNNDNVTKHIIMNLPAIAPEFLDTFRERYATLDTPLKAHPNIFVHCYCFATTKTPEIEAQLMASEVLGVDISSGSKTYFVRRVAPNKVMMCISFNLMWFEHDTKKHLCTSSNGIGNKHKLEDDVYPVPKKVCGDGEIN